MKYRLKNCFQTAFPFLSILSTRHGYGDGFFPERGSESGKRGFVCQHDFGDVEPVQTASGKQLDTTVVRIRNGFFRFRLPLEIFFGNDKSTADRIINLFLQYRAV